MIFHKKISTIIITCIVFGGCGENPAVEIHPVESRIPYIDYSVESIKIEKNSSDDSVQNIPHEVSLFRKSSLSEYFEISQFQLMDVPLMTDQWIQIETLDKNRVVLFDIERQQIYEYQLEENFWNEIAHAGQGPDELSFVNDLTVRNDTIFVVSKDSKINLFDCGNGLCNYAQSVNINQNLQPVSIMPVTNHFLVLGNKITSRTGATSMVDENSLFKVNSQGELIQSWGQIYDTQGHWMLLEPFSRGKIRAIGQSNEVLHYFESFPFLYHYSDEDELKKIFRLSDFDLEKRKYDPNTGELWIPNENYNLINNVTIKDQNYLIISVLDRKINNREDRTSRWDETKDFYLIDTIKDESYFLGSLNNIPMMDLIFTKEHIILRNGDRYHIALYSMK